MMVISDTSSLNYLVLIDLQDVLPTLFGHVLIPEAVRHELSSPAAPQPVKYFLDTWPSWLRDRSGRHRRAAQDRQRQRQPAAGAGAGGGLIFSKSQLTPGHRQLTLGDLQLPPEAPAGGVKPAATP